MLKFRILAAFAAFAMMCGLAPSIKMSQTGGVELTTLTSAAYADEGKAGERHWMPGGSREEVVDSFLAGDEPCVGSKRNHSCYSYDPVLQTLHIQRVSRPIGYSKNVVENIDVALDGKNVVLRTENGTPMVMFQIASEQQNGTAIWGTALANILPAAFNGVGAAGIQAAFPACRGSCGGQGVVNVVTSNAGSLSSSNSALNAALSGGGCGTGACGTTPPATTHTQNGPGN